MFAGCTIVIATPNRLATFAAKKQLHLARTTHLVLDEADMMLDQGFEQELKKIGLLVPQQRHTAICTAWISEGVKALISSEYPLLFDTWHKINMG